MGNTLNIGLVDLSSFGIWVNNYVKVTNKFSMSVQMPRHLLALRKTQPACGKWASAISQPVKFKFATLFVLPTGLFIHEHLMFLTV